MPEVPNEHIELYRACGMPEAHAIRLLLENEEIPVRIDNEFLQGALGDLPLGWNTAPRIMVGRAHEAAARAILDRFLQRREEPEERADSRLRCLCCGEPMEE